MSILVDRGTVVTVDKDRRIIRDGAIAIEEDKIVAVGKSEEVKRTFQAERIIDAQDKLIIPGLIDAHLHFVKTISRGIADDIDFFSWLYDRTFPFEAAMSEEDAYLGALLGCIEMIKTGTTCFAELGGYRMESGARAIEEAGVRGIIAWRCVDTIVDEKRPMPGVTISTAEDAVRRNEELFDRFDRAAGGRIRVWFGIADPRAASDDLIVKVHKKAKELNTGIEIHVAAAEEAVRWLVEHKGKPDIEYLESLGVLGPEMLIVHAGWITPEAVKIISRHDVKVCHCPGASMHGAYGSCSRGKFPELIEQGVTVCLGVDTAAENNSLDMFRAMYQAATCHKEARLDNSLISPEQALEMATINGARALMWEDEIGSIEVGKKADLVLIDIKKPNWLPIYDFSTIPNLVYSGDGADVDTVIIDGKIVMEGREIKTLDERKILTRVQEAGARILARSGLDRKLKPRWPFY